MGDFKQDVNTRTVLDVMRLLDGLGMNVFADLGALNRDLWCRSRLIFERQKVRLSPFQRYSLLVTDTVDSHADAAAVWRVSYTSRPPQLTGTQDVVVPYGMDPTLTYRRANAPLPRNPLSPRPIRILFAGQCTQEGYDRRHLIGQRYGKLTRYALVSHLRAKGLVHEPDTLEALRALLAPSQRRDFVFVDTRRFSIPIDQWLDVVAASDFFFCPPGNIFPICHNIIEAMAVGTIPITSYPEWLTPALIRGETCLEFDTFDSLDAAIAAALDMDRAAIEDMRNRVIAHYDTHLDYRKVALRLLPRMGEPLRLHVLDETFHRVEALPSISAASAIPS
ncbi:MAG: glycosyltransferase [Planctomycetia bacterium]